MAMSQLRDIEIPIVEPFLEVTCLAYAVRCKSRSDIATPISEGSIVADEFRCGGTMIEQVAQQLPIHRRTCAHRSIVGMHVFRRHRWHGHQTAVFGMSDERVEE